MEKSKCEICGKEFNFSVVPYAHRKSCERKYGVEPVEPVLSGKFNREAFNSCLELIKLNINGYFDIRSMSGNERGMVNRLLQESDEVIGVALTELLNNHGIKTE